MSSLNEGLILALTLEDTDAGLADDSGQGANGTIQGEVVAVPDELFGSCLRFPGTGDAIVQVPDQTALRLTGDLTVQAWVYLEQSINDWVRIIGKGEDANRNYGLWYHHQLRQWLFQELGTGALPNVVYQANEIKLNTWYHLAGVRQGDRAVLYLNGAQVAENAGLGGAPHTSADPVTIGYAGFHSAHTGLIARARIHNRALAGEEIRRSMEMDRLALPAFRKSHPVEFSLYDDHNQYVLYIDDDPTGHRLNLELHNTSAQALQLQPGASAVASADNHHIELRFRAGTLSANTLAALRNPAEKEKILGNGAEWDLIVPSNGVAGREIVSLFLLYKGSESLFQPDTKRSLALSHFSAAAAGGARGTQVELELHQMAFVGSTTPLTGSRVQLLHIANQSGRKHIPLHVDFIGPNRILNDGVSHLEKEDALLLQIMNVIKVRQGHTGSSEIALLAENQPKGIAASKLIVTFEVQESGQNEPWALCQAAELNQFAIAATLVKQVKQTNQGKEIWVEQSEQADIKIEPSAGGLGESRQWTLTPRSDIRLNPGDYLLLKTDGLKSSLASGLANVYLHYENIPGYWDGHFTCRVEKSPLLLHDVAQGQTDYVAHLSSPANNLLFLQSRTGGPGNTVNVDFQTYAAIGQPHPTARLSIVDESYSSHIAFLTKEPGRNENALVERFRLSNNGNLGIGTPAPTEKLEVNGNVKLTSWGRGIQFIDAMAAGGEVSKGTVGAVSYVDMQIGFPGPAFGGKLTIGRWTTSSPSTFEELMRVQSDGNVGIGTTAPTNRLQINNVYHGSAGYGLTVSQEQYGANIQIKRRAGEGGIGLVVDNNETGDANTLMFLVRNNVKAYPNNQNLFVIRADGNVGIGLISPANKLDIQAVNRTGGHPSNRPLYVTGDIGASDNGIEFRHTNGSQGIGFGFNTIYATGSNADQHLNLMPKGNNGNVGIGTTDPQRRLHVIGSGQPVMRLQTIGSGNRLSQTWDILIDVDDVNDQDLMFLFNEGRNTGNWASAWIEPNGGVGKPSDRKMKTDIKPLTDALENVLALKPRTFRWKGRKDEKRAVGFIAQEVEEVLPELVRTKQDFKGLTYDDFTVLAIGAIQEQQKMIAQLQQRVETFEGRPEGPKKGAASKKKASSSARTRPKR